MMPIPEQKDPIGLLLLKWVVIPCILISVFFMTVTVYTGKRTCVNMAKERGFVESQYTPSYRYTAGSCVMKKKKLPSGMIDNDAIMKVEMK
jgi:hypothetical protein